MSIRSSKIGNLIRDELYPIIKFGRILHPDLEKYVFSITSVLVSPDLSIARCYIMSYDIRSLAKIIDILNKISKVIGFEFGKKINLRKVPKLVFIDAQFAPQDIKYKDEYGL